MPTTGRRRPHPPRLVAMIVVAILVVGAGVMAGPHAAAAVDGATISSATVYRIDDDTGTVRVESTYEFTNTSPDRDLGDGRTEFRFFRGVTVPVHTTATDVVVQVNGQDAGFDRTEIGTGFDTLDVSFGFQLRFPDSASVSVRSTLVGDPPRDPDSSVRVNPAYVSFPVVAFADDGRADLRVETPARWVPDYIGDELIQRDDGDRSIFEAIAIERPLEFGAFFTARIDDRLDAADVSTGNATFRIRSWPGDVAWRDFATRYVTDGVPVLESLVGARWPDSERTHVVEATTPYLRGYAGWYSASRSRIEIGEELDAQTMLHELAHAWLNSRAISARWISEGFAEEASARALEALGDDLPTPRTDDELRADGFDVEPFPLNEWPDPDFDGTDDPRERYGYAASARVMRALSDEIGIDATTSLLSAVVAGQQAYADDDDDPAVADAAERGTVDWRALLDLAEQVGGSTQFQLQLVEMALTADEADELARRNLLVDEYDTLVQRGGPWGAPATVRVALARWGLEDASSGITQANVVLDRRDELAEVLAPLDLIPADAIRRTYEHRLEPLDAVAEQLAAHVAPAGDLAATRALLADALEPIGQDVPALLQADYDADPIGIAGIEAAVAADAQQMRVVHDALDDVLGRLALSMPPLDRTAFVGDAAAALEELERRLAAAESVEEAHIANDESRSLIENIGAIGGTDVDARLAEADAALVAGDTERAAARAAAAIDALDSLGATGATRLIIAAASLVVLLIAIGWGVRGRRRVDRVADEAPTPSGFDDGEHRLEGVEVVEEDDHGGSIAVDDQPPAVDRVGDGGVVGADVDEHRPVE